VWKATKKIKHVKKPSPPLRASQGTWARSNVKMAHAFDEHLALIHLLVTPHQLEPPINRLKRAEVKEVINSLNPKKSLGYDLITGKILKELLIIGVTYLTKLFNAILFKGYFPAEWKVPQIILILKPGKPPNELTVLPANKPLKQSTKYGIQDSYTS
jgi:hypothetical protein